jgi:hypothetical protein
VARGHTDMSAVAALAAALGVMSACSQDRNQALSWARSEGLEPPTF